MYTFLAGMAGASIRPWHIGVTVLVLELVLVGAVAAVWA
jgi:hypothetical protein